MEETLAALGSHPELFTTTSTEAPVRFSVSERVDRPSYMSKTVEFPSEDTDTGSILYIWPGPPSDDVESILALEVLFRYLSDHSGSLINQAFVERKRPLASDVDLDMRSFVDCPLQFGFYGVPFLSSEEGSEEGDSTNGSSEGSLLDGSEDGSENEPEKEDLFAGDLFYKKVISCLDQFVKEGCDMDKTIVRHCRKYLEAMEDCPHEFVTSMIITDVVRYYSFIGGMVTDGPMKVGLKLNSLAILEGLKSKKEEFWKALVEKYFVHSSVCEVKMVPSSDLALAIIERDKLEEQLIIKRVGKKGFKRIKEKLETVLKDNQVDLSGIEICQIPNASKVQKIYSEMANFENSLGLIGDLQVVYTETKFIHFGFGLNLKGLPSHLRAYLVLFQELLFQSKMIFGTTKMDYKEVSKYASDLLISYECGVGFGNSLFTTSYMSDVLTLFATSPAEDYERTIIFLSQVLVHSQFEKDRLVTICMNLLSSIVDIKRDGSAVNSAVTSRLTSKGSLEYNISIFDQEKFLKNVLTLLKDGLEDDIIANLNAIRDFVLTSDPSNPTFIRIAVPKHFSYLYRDVRSTPEEISKDVIRLVESVIPATDNKKRKVSRARAFPYPRVAYIPPTNDLSIMVPITIPSSYLCQFVPCDLLSKPKHPDYFPTVLLAEILSRPEGPLYLGIRGQGYAYGASLNCYLWAGQLSFDLYRASEPQKALAVLYEILKDLYTTEGFDRLCSQFEIETASASIAYRWASAGSTASSLISTCLKSSLQGFKGLSDYTGFISELYKVTKEDLQRVLREYYSRFFEKIRMTVLTTGKGEEARLVKAFEEGEKKGRVEFVVKALSEF